MRRLKVASAALLLSLVAAGAVLPLAAAGAGHRGCFCTVRMACCEEGTCAMGGDEPPATNPEWRRCRREAPSDAETALDAFERALTSSAEEKSARIGSRVAEVSIACTHPTAPGPATPPPRPLSF